MINFPLAKVCCLKPTLPGRRVLYAGASEAPMIPAGISKEDYDEIASSAGKLKQMAKLEIQKECIMNALKTCEQIT